MPDDLAQKMQNVSKYNDDGYAMSQDAFLLRDKGGYWVFCVKR